jgi:hypothetical protein
MTGLTLARRILIQLELARLALTHSALLTRPTLAWLTLVLLS